MRPQGRCRHAVFLGFLIAPRSRAVLTASDETRKVVPRPWAHLAARSEGAVAGALDSHTVLHLDPERLIQAFPCLVQDNQERVPIATLAENQTEPFHELLRPPHPNEALDDRGCLAHLEHPRLLVNRTDVQVLGAVVLASAPDLLEAWLGKRDTSIRELTLLDRSQELWACHAVTGMDEHAAQRASLGLRLGLGRRQGVSHLLNADTALLEHVAEVDKHLRLDTGKCHEVVADGHQLLELVIGELAELWHSRCLNVIVNVNVNVNVTVYGSPQSKGS